MTNWGLLHDIRGPRSADHIIGYECKNDKEEWHIFVCAYHEDGRYFEEWTPVTVKDTHSQCYQCDRMGCEVSYWQEWIQEEKL